LRNDKTANEIASHYGVNQNVISCWKQTAIEGLPELFEGKIITVTISLLII